VRRVKRSPGERRARLAELRGFDGPEVVEWIFTTDDG